MNTSRIFFLDEDLFFMSLPHPLLIAPYDNTSRHYEGQLCCPPWLLDHIKRNNYLDAGQIKNVTATVLRIRALSLMYPLSMIFFSFQTCRGMFFALCFVPQFTNTFRTQRKYRDPGCISSSNLCRMQTYCGHFCLSDYRKDENRMLVEMTTNMS